MSGMRREYEMVAAGLVLWMSLMELIHCVICAEDRVGACSCWVCAEVWVRVQWVWMELIHTRWAVCKEQSFGVWTGTAHAGGHRRRGLTRRVRK